MANALLELGPCTIRKFRRSTCCTSCFMAEPARTETMLHIQMPITVRSMCRRRSLHPSTPVVYTRERSRTPGRDLTGASPDSSEGYGIPIYRMGGPATAAAFRGTALEAGSLVIDHCLSRIFVAAYLLTGSARQAEALSAESIRELDIGATRRACLSWKAVVAAIMRGESDSEQAPDERPLALPIELLRVLRLSPRLRQCFVLRVLMAMPRQYCAGLLCIAAEQVDANCDLAAQELALIATGGAPTGGKWEEFA